MPATGSPSLTKILGITALADLLAGIVLSAIGLSQDMQVLSIVGVVLLISGGGMLAWVALSRNRPEAI